MLRIPELQIVSGIGGTGSSVIYRQLIRNNKRVICSESARISAQHLLWIFINAVIWLRNPFYVLLQIG